MRPGTVIILEQLTLTSMAVHGIYEYLCEEGGIDGSSPELDAKIDAVKEAGEALDKARAALLRVTPA